MDPSETETPCGAVVRGLRQSYPGAECALHHADPFQLLVATVLSAQCTDKRVNQVTPALFARFPTPARMAAGDRAEIERLIQSTGFFRNKAKSLLGLSRAIETEFGGKVPTAMDGSRAAPRRGTQDRQRRAGDCFRFTIRRGRRHACSANQPPARADAAHGAGQDRARPDETASAQGVDRLFSSCDSPRSADLQSSPAAVRKLSVGQTLSSRGRSLQPGRLKTARAVAKRAFPYSNGRVHRRKTRVTESGHDPVW